MSTGFRFLAYIDNKTENVLDLFCLILCLKMRKTGETFISLKEVVPMMKFSELPVYLQALLGAFGAFLLTVFGAALVFVMNGEKEKSKKVFDGFSAGVMLSAAFFSLLLPALEVPVRPLRLFGESSSAILVTSGFLFGSLLICGANLLFLKRGEKAGGVRLLYASVTLHNVPEGLAVGVAFSGGILPGLTLALGIGIQNFPEGFCLAYPLKKHGCSKLKSFLLSVLSGAIEIPCAVIGAILFSSGGYMAFALAFAAGAMTAVTVTELIADAFGERDPLTLFSFSLGFCFIMILDLLFS